MRLGCHLSIAKGLSKSAQMAEEVQANTFQFFTRNPRGGKARTISEKEIEGWKEIREKDNLFPIAGHLPYTVNLAAPKDSTHSFASSVLLDDLVRMDKIKAEFLVVHPGSHVGEGRESGIKRIVEALENSFLKFQGGSNLLLEAMAGQGSEIGTLEDLKEIMEAAGSPEGLGVCLDTCHLFAAGYDFTRADEVERLLEELESLFGLGKVKLFHLNDSKHPPGSKKDRHELLGKGYLKKEGLLNVLIHPAFEDIPFIIETPTKNYLEYGEEIKLIRSWLKERV